MKFLKVNVLKESQETFLNLDGVRSFSTKGKHTDIRFDGMLLSVHETVEDLLGQLQTPPLAVRILPGAPSKWARLQSALAMRLTKFKQRRLGKL